MKSKRLIILEGPDGAGKSTLARRLADDMGARLVHHGPYRGVSGMDLARLYVESMMPAVLGHQDVVLDRCWISEKPYGDVFRGGAYRLDDLTRAIERLAWRCKTSVLACLPSWDTVATNFLRNKGEQMLDRVDQLRGVYDGYTTAGGLTSLPVTVIDPFRYDDPKECVIRAQLAEYSLPHAYEGTAGNMRGAKALIVVDDPGPWDQGDTLFRWPFGELNDNADSPGRTMSRLLDFVGVSERRLYWAVASVVTPAIKRLPLKVIAVGAAAHAAVLTHGRTPDLVLPGELPDVRTSTHVSHEFHAFKETV